MFGGFRRDCWAVGEGFVFLGWVAVQELEEEWEEEVEGVVLEGRADGGSR